MAVFESGIVLFVQPIWWTSTSQTLVFFFFFFQLETLRAPPYYFGSHGASVHRLSICPLSSELRARFRRRAF